MISSGAVIGDYPHRFKILILLFFAFCLTQAQTPSAPWLHVHQIVLTGNARTRPQIILREMTLNQGDSLEARHLSEEIEKSRQNLFNLALFNEVHIQPEIVEDRLYLLVSLEERWYLFPIPNLAIEERNTFDLLQNQNLHRLVYGLNVQWRNVTGRNEQINAYGQLGFSKRFYLDLVKPFFLQQQYVDLQLKVRYIREPEIIYGTHQARAQWGLTYSEPLRETQSLRVGLRKRLGDVRKSLLLELGYFRFQFSDSLFHFNPSFIPIMETRMQYPALVLTFANDQRDYKSFPLKGFKYQLFFRQVGLLGWGSTSFTKMGLSWAHHIPLSDRWNVAYGTHWMFSHGKEIPFFEKNFIGYQTGEFSGISYDLRGYAPYTIGGSFLNMTKIECKYGLVPLQQLELPYMPLSVFSNFPFGLYLTAFADMGYVQDKTFNNEDEFLKDQLLYGYGLGLNIIGFYDNLLRIEFARNHLKQAGMYLHGLVPIK